MIFQDFSIKEQLLGIISLKGRTAGQEIFNSFVTESIAPLHKLVCITTDWAK
jgi:hypothetical protein